MQPLGYQETPKGLGVPYLRDDPGSHSYVDLKKDPAAIDLLPELRDEPALRGVISKLNEPGGYMRSIGCEKWSSDKNQDHPGVSFASYVDFAIDAWPFERKEASQAIWQRFDEYRKRGEWPDVTKEFFILQPTHFEDPGVTGWSVGYWAGGYGATVEEAHAVWSTLMGRFAVFVEEEQAYWRAFLARTPFAALLAE